jgi:HEAT repeat protein
LSKLVNAATAAREEHDMPNEELSMRRIRPRWPYVMILCFGLLAAGCETLDGGPAAAALLRQKEAPPLRGPAADLFAELDQALDATSHVRCGIDDVCMQVKQANAKLAALGPRVIPALLHRMVHVPGRRGDAAADVLVVMSKRARPAVPTLVALLEDAPGPVRHRVVRSLSGIGIASTPVLDALVEIYEDQDQDQHLRHEAGFAIIGLTWRGHGRAALDDADDAIAALRMLIEDGERPGLRREAVRALATIRPASDEVLEGLIHALHDQDIGVRVAATRALNRLKGLTQ